MNSSFELVIENLAINYKRTLLDLSLNSAIIALHKDISPYASRVNQISNMLVSFMVFVIYKGHTHLNNGSILEHSAIAKETLAIAIEQFGHTGKRINRLKILRRSSLVLKLDIDIKGLSLEPFAETCFEIKLRVLQALKKVQGRFAALIDGDSTIKIKDLLTIATTKTRELHNCVFINCKMPSGLTTSFSRTYKIH